MRCITAITFTRSDYNSFVPVLRALDKEPDFQTQLIVSGTHLSPRFGHTVDQIESDRFRIADRVEMEAVSDSPEGVVKSVGVAMVGFAQAFTRLKTDLIILVGDRLELLAAATAALTFRIPVGHISGGDITEGAIDNQVRDAVTRMSHLHFVAMQEHADRVISMGEEPWRVHVTGEPALDLLKDMPLLSRDELTKALGMELRPPVVAITYHPTTLGTRGAKAEVEALLQALNEMQGTFVISAPNADVERDIILDGLQRFTSQHSSARIFPSLGPLNYYSLLSHADLMVGNSSSGIWESPSFRLPVVNIGERQQGRRRAENVVDVASEPEAIRSGIRRALQPDFRSSLSNLRNPYGEGDAAPKIVKVLKQLNEMPSLIQKKTYQGR